MLVKPRVKQAVKTQAAKQSGATGTANRTKSGLWTSSLRRWLVPGGFSLGVELSESGRKGLRSVKAEQDAQYQIEETC